MTHVDVLDLVRRNTGALDRGGDRERRQVVGPDARQGTAVPPDGRANG